MEDSKRIPVLIFWSVLTGISFGILIREAFVVYSPPASTPYQKSTGCVVEYSMDGKNWYREGDDISCYPYMRLNVYAPPVKIEPSH